MHDLPSAHKVVCLRAQLRNRAAHQGNESIEVFRIVAKAERVCKIIGNVKVGLGVKQPAWTFVWLLICFAFGCFGGDLVSLDQILEAEL